jgi:hypothetical protein
MRRRLRVSAVEQMDLRDGQSVGIRCEQDVLANGWQHARNR